MGSGRFQICRMRNGKGEVGMSDLSLVGMWIDGDLDLKPKIQCVQHAFLRNV